MLFNKRFSGIDFRDNKVTFATVRLDRGIPIVENIDEISFEDPVITNGDIADEEALADGLHSYLKSNKKVSKHVHLAIPTQKTLIRKVTTLPDLEEKELGKLLHFQIGETIHLPFEDPIYDFVKIGSVKAQVQTEKVDEDELTLDDLANSLANEIEGDRSEILLFATSRTLSQNLLDSCEEAGFKPISAEIRALALQRLLLYAHPNWLKKTEMILDLNGEAVDIHIFHQGLIVFTRSMSIDRRNMFAQIITEEDVLPFDHDTFFEENEVAATREIASQHEEEYITNIMNEIQKSQNFYRYSLGERDSELTRIIVTGEDARMIASHLKERIAETEVAQIDFRSIIVHSDVNQSLADRCSVAIGLALRANDKADKKKT